MNNFFFTLSSSDPPALFDKAARLMGFRNGDTFEEIFDAVRDFSPYEERFAPIECRLQIPYLLPSEMFDFISAAIAIRSEQCEANGEMWLSA